MSNVRKSFSVDIDGIPVTLTIGPDGATIETDDNLTVLSYEDLELLGELIEAGKDGMSD